jgi:trimethylamine--corrinoid protein Co-methyltransferase
MGYEKFIMDCDQASMISVLLGGMDMSENGQALDAVREVGPGKHYLGSAHTLKNFEAAFYRSTVADNNSYEQWQADGSLDTAQRANGLWKKMLSEYQPPALDVAVDEALLDFMARRKGAFADRDY